MCIHYASKYGVFFTERDTLLPLHNEPRYNKTSVITKYMKNILANMVITIYLYKKNFGHNKLILMQDVTVITRFECSMCACHDYLGHACKYTSWELLLQGAAGLESISWCLLRLMAAFWHLQIRVTGTLAARATLPAFYHLKTLPPLNNSRFR